MRYRKLSKDDPLGDYVFGHGGDDYYRDVPEAPGQAVLTRLRLFNPEWMFDLFAGTPYRTQILGKYTQDTWERAVQQRIRQTEGVLSLDSFSAVYDAGGRHATINAEITTIYGAELLRTQLEVALLPLYGQ